MDGCVACALTRGTVDLPGGRIYETPCWVVEHCVGPLGVGTLIVKPIRHVQRVWELTAAEARELGPLLRLATDTIHGLLSPDQVYVCLWSHAGWTPGHLHFVLQPAWNAWQERYAHPGTTVQEAMFEANVLSPRHAVEDFADRARALMREISRAPVFGAE